MGDANFRVFFGCGNRPRGDFEVSVFEKFDSVDDAFVESDFFNFRVPHKAECVCGIFESLNVHLKIGDARFNQREIGI